MDIVIVSIIVAVAVFFTLKRLVRRYKGEGGCSCSEGCSSKAGGSCCSENTIVPKK